mmetsp:Transcript_26807/g.57007  ORF Transcript_26807/g.57007 Transcript_26807/m.57007 type:complete len:237 (+) Transcript_26807:105-815(+)|eukprot:CAMPEP_0172551176 /NCGR_PEP_ID=MMETSP1067-20121228/36664_1 /TAXON_ID=265564 ORGANISM="Thalassiosira punctigera, Strain Tpunct2005C2" /NCGR_SAMPLE_ID=MMETSP1067 /ASSEMBLY_ACC=CAM_ASM_000444 /LENGTH=236 /DNA_ID=CAMNT_0013338923 /DNA_START=107 /DNA_END=817 /DNA_ORIENTATION=-
MVSLKKMKIRTPSFRRKTKKERVEKEETVEADELPTVQITPVENDPIMEDREDAEETNAAPAPSLSAEEERQVEDDERSPPADDEAEPEPEAEAEVEPEAEEPALKGIDDDSVMTEAKEAVDDALSTVKEEPSKEEAEEKAAEESAPPAEKDQEDSATLDHTLDDEDGEDLTMEDATATTFNDTGCATIQDRLQEAGDRIQEAGCNLPANMPKNLTACVSPVHNSGAFCGCFELKL